MKKFALLFLCLCTIHGKAQNLPKYRNLVMEGGGILGIAYGGALDELEKRGILKDILRVAGTSAGAIQASLVAVGYTAEEISEIIANTPIETFNDDGFVSRGTKRLMSEYGWFKGESFLNTIEKLIGMRTGNPNLTFADLHQLARSYPFRDLYVIGADLSDQKTVIFSFDNFPDMRVADAVRISMSIPLYYKALWADKNGKIHDSPSAENQCHLFVDGGILQNFPIDIFDQTKYLSENDQVKNEAIFNPETIGLRIDRCEQIEHETFNGEGIAPYQINDFSSYLSALSSILMRNVSPPHPKDIERTVFISDLGMSARVRKVPEMEKNQLMDSGRLGIIDFFDRLNLLSE